MMEIFICLFVGCVYFKKKKKFYFDIDWIIIFVEFFLIRIFLLK